MFTWPDGGTASIARFTATSSASGIAFGTIARTCAESVAPYTDTAVQLRSLVQVDAWVEHRHLDRQHIEANEVGARRNRPRTAFRATPVDAKRAARLQASTASAKGMTSRQQPLEWPGASGHL